MFPQEDGVPPGLIMHDYDEEEADGRKGLPIGYKKEATIVESRNTCSNTGFNFCEGRIRTLQMISLLPCCVNVKVKRTQRSEMEPMLCL